MEIIEEIPAFYDPTGDGALQVSAFQNKDGEYELTNVMKNYLSRHKISYNPSSIANFVDANGCEVQACEFISEGRFWMVYMLARGSLLVLCTYNGDERPDKVQSRIIQGILRSIQVEEE